MKHMHPQHLPFSDSQLLEHFVDPKDSHLEYYRNSLGRLEAFEDGTEAMSVAQARQVEKDERFWTAATLVSLARHKDAARLFARVLAKTFEDGPPVQDADDWHDLLVGNLRLYLEVHLGSPRSYREWRRDHGAAHPIPYVRERALAAGLKQEGATHADAVLVNPDTGFAVIFEAKALSDVSTSVSFDPLRNQIVRNVDCLLEKPATSAKELDGRDPQRTLFVLLTPRLFQERRQSRLYGWLMDEYRRDPSSLERDLPHRRGSDVDWPALARRMGWLTWEDVDDVLPGACSFLDRGPGPAPQR